MIFKIKKGKQKHKNWIAWILLFFAFGKIKQFVVFSTGAWYQKNSEENRGPNQLTGISHFKKHKNQATALWEPDFDYPGMINVFAQVYDNSKKKNPVLIGTIPINRKFKVTIEAKKSYYRFEIAGKEYLAPCEKPNGLIRKFPAFAEKTTAPNDMEFKITNI